EVVAVVATGWVLVGTERVVLVTAGSGAPLGAGLGAVAATTPAGLVAGSVAPLHPARNNPVERTAIVNARRGLEVGGVEFMP
ncbi:MAG TPA: hypothetical protein VF180_01695, partial [Acidimicrobiia bacterium]